MITLTVSEVIALHSKLITATGGSDGVRDVGLLESAVYSADVSFDDIEKYPTTEEKASRLAYSLTLNHAFVDGNKRIGILVMLLTLKLNKITIRYTQKELIDLGLDIASRKLNYEDVLEWVRNHQ